MSKTRLLLVLILILMAGAYFLFDLGQYFSLEFFRSQQEKIELYFADNPLQTALIFFCIYVAVTGLSLPGAAIMTLVGGAIFGLLWGTVIISFASTLGATVAFLVSRFLLRNYVQSRFSRNLKAINAGVRKDGTYYLFTLRLIPLFPFFVINLVMGLTPISTLKFFLVSQVGMLPGTLVYVNAGTQIAKIDSISGILSPPLLISFALLGIFPLIAKYTVAFIHARKTLGHYKKPACFDYNLIVIGAGSAGLVSAYIAAAVKARVALIEKHKMGGECLNTGCVPSKAIIRSAKFLHQLSRATDFGFKSAHADFDFADVMARVHRVIEKVEPHDSVERYTRLGVDCIHGAARITSPYTIEVNGETLTTRNIIVATGGRPYVPEIEGIDTIDYHTSDTIWSIRELPKRLIVLGGGPIGCELAQVFARFGSQVTIVQRQPTLLKREDLEIAEMVEQQFVKEGIDVRLSHTAESIKVRDGVQVLGCVHDSQSVEIEFDTLLLALGREPHIHGFGLGDLDIALSPQGTVEVNDYMQTSMPNIYACGDVAGPYQFTHVAAHQAWYCAVNALFGRFRKFKVDYSVIPWATFTDPEVARVGLNEKQAEAENIAYEVTRYGIDDLDRAIADESAHGVVKVLTEPGRDRILGVTIVGEHAGDLITEYITAMRYNLGMNKILGTIHIYPTLAEANKYAAGNWKRAHAPETLLRWIARYHRWSRGA
ncbi:MAG: FAD-dependent oxidoreductase [Gammaproteobacteria bacterium]|nr:FAD-dependent oxidoreductase [Gammaproteobacteria bacterium]